MSSVVSQSVGPSGKAADSSAWWPVSHSGGALETHHEAGCEATMVTVSIMMITAREAVVGHGVCGPRIMEVPRTLGVVFTCGNGIGAFFRNSERVGRRSDPDRD